MISPWATVMLLAGIFMYSSCENQAFLPPYQPEEQVSVKTSIQNGEILLSSQTVQLNLEYDQASEVSPDYLELEIFDRNRNSLGIQTIEGDALFEPLPSLTPSEDKEGFFILQMRLYDINDEILQEREIPFFKVDLIPQISQIEVYPPDSLHPESTGLLVPSVSGGGDDVWVRWKMGPVLLDKGPLSEFEDGYKWTSPEKEGVYSITLEAFPVAPPEEEGDFSFDSSIKSEVQFYVQERRGSRSGELGPESSYHTLLHFDGSFYNTGTEVADFSRIESPLLSVSDGLFGYYFSPVDGVKSEAGGFSFPAPAELQPFTLTFQGIPSRDIQEDAHIFSFQGSNGEDILQLVTDSVGNPLLYRPDTGGVLHSPSDFPFRNLRELSISFIPQGDELVTVKWYRNGRMVSRGVISSSLFPQETWYGVQLGGEKPQQGKTGFEGLFDEFGLYYRNEEQNPSEDTRIYQRWIQREFGERDVLKVDGFEDTPEDALVVEQDQISAEGANENSEANEKSETGEAGDGDSGADPEVVKLLSEFEESWDKVGMILYFEDAGDLRGGGILIGPVGSSDTPGTHNANSAAGEQVESGSEAVTGTVSETAKKAGLDTSDKSSMLRIGFDGSVSPPSGPNTSQGEAQEETQEGVQEETQEGLGEASETEDESAVGGALEVTFSSEDFLNNNVVKLALTRENGEVVVSTADGKEIYRTDEWQGKSLKAEITHSRGYEGLERGQLRISELLLLRDLSTFKNYY